MPISPSDIESKIIIPKDDFSPSDIESKIIIPKDDSTSIRISEAEFLYELVTREKPGDTLETGLAYGRSASYIMAAGKGKHTTIDLFQKNFDNTGLKNIEKLGFSNRLEFFEEESHLVLPRLISQNRKFDFAFVDGDHRFDGIFIDFQFSARLLNPGGMIAFHDTWMRSTQLVLSWIRTNRKEFVEEKIPHTTMALFRKKAEDTRAWHHFEEFYSSKKKLSFQLRKKISGLKGKSE